MSRNRLKLSGCFHVVHPTQLIYFKVINVHSAPLVIKIFRIKKRCVFTNCRRYISFLFNDNINVKQNHLGWIDFVSDFLVMCFVWICFYFRIWPIRLYNNIKMTDTNAPLMILNGMIPAAMISLRLFATSAKFIIIPNSGSSTK